MTGPREEARRFALAAYLLLRDLLRRRVAVLLLFLVPALFDAVALTTTSDRYTTVTFAALVEPGAEVRPAEEVPSLFEPDLKDRGERTVNNRQLSLVFLGSAAVCFLSCFLAFYLVHRRTEVDGRLVLAGYRPYIVLGAKLAVLIAVVVALALYETTALRALFAPRDLTRVACGLALGGLLYGCAGLLIGAVTFHELDGVFLIVLLTNVDVGWLQNPAYYAESARRGFIEALPGFAPAQIAMVGALTYESAWRVAARGLVWAGALLLGALIAFGWRIRPAPPRVSDRSAHRRFYVKVFILAYLIWIAAFEMVGRYAATLPTVDLTSPWDRALPLVPAFVWPYELCYLYPIAALFVVKDWRCWNRGLLALLIANLTAFCVYLLLPISFPKSELGRSLAEQLLAAEYAADFHPGANHLPSLHVAISWIIFCAMRGQRGRLFDAANLSAALAITVSTVMVKQHILIDAVAGVVWGLGSWRLARLLEPKLSDPDAAPEAALKQLFSPSRWARLFQPRFVSRRSERARPLTAAGRT